MAGRLKTGIDVLDRKLNGGLPAGCIVALTASPSSQAELLLYELTAWSDRWVVRYSVPRAAVSS